jgi:hypothetical protein
MDYMWLFIKHLFGTYMAVAAAVACNKKLELSIYHLYINTFYISNNLQKKKEK